MCELASFYGEIRLVFIGNEFEKLDKISGENGEVWPVLGKAKGG